MVKSIHDLSEDEMYDLSRQIKELFRDFPQPKEKDEAKIDELNSDNFEQSSRLPSIEESKETDENTATSENISEKQSDESKIEMLNREYEKKSSSTESLQHSETFNIEHSIKNDGTLNELKNLTSQMSSNDDESMSKENEMTYSSASWSRTTLKKQTENFSVDSTIVRKTNRLDPNANKAFGTNLRSKSAKEDTIIDKNTTSLKFDNKSSNSGELRRGNYSSYSLRLKNKQLNKEQLQNVSSDSVKRKPYSEGFPDYIKGHHVPIILKREKLENEVGREPSAVSTRSTDKHEKSVSIMSNPEEVPPLFPLKINCISMFSDDEEETDGVEEESSSDSDSGSEDRPDVIFNKLWQDLLLPTDESDMDVEEFYKQFPKLKKKKRFRESKEEVFFKTLT